MRERGAEFGAKADSSNLQSGRAAYWSQNPRPVTVLENILCDVILADFPDCQREVPFGVYTVDAYIPSLHVAFEADGYWHTRHAARDVARDVWLLRKFDLPVIRLTERDLMEAIA